MTVSVFDVAQYILRHGPKPISAMKLQKLVYYSQAWHTAWHENALFSEKIEAWADGPVVPELFKYHKGIFHVKSLPKGDSKKLSAKHKDTVDRVLKFYGDKSPQWLSDLTHMEDPWRNARVGLRAGEASSVEITPAALFEYYSKL